ncbi:MAG: TCR/Tet family MFS transporter [Longimicrobiales bacterium]|nr:TCR/Tet family MFS transporter [Longimicrobiales bacterium]
MRRATFVFIFLVVLLDMLALGIIAPVLPMLILEFEGGESADAAAVYGLFASVWAAAQFLCAPLLGALSDRFGRRPVILISCIGLGLDYFFMALAPTLGWLFVGRVVSGVTASSFATAYAYVADLTPPDERAKRYGYLGAAFGVGFVVGPALGGLLGDIALRLPFWVAGVLSLVGAAYGYFVLPESLPEEKRAPFSLRRANPLGALGLLASRGGLLALAAIAFLYRIAHDALPSLFVLYTDYRYGWTERDVGLALALVGVGSMIVQAGLVGRVVSALGERRTMLTGLAFGIVSFLVYGLAPTGGVFLSGILFGSLYGLMFPALQGRMTRRVAADEQGRLQGAITSLMGVAGVVAPLLFTQTFAAAVGPYEEYGMPGAPFLIGGGLLVVAIIVDLAAGVKPPIRAEPVQGHRVDGPW